jgi:hypothetical protein
MSVHWQQAERTSVHTLTLYVQSHSLSGLVPLGQCLTVSYDEWQSGYRKSFAPAFSSLRTVLSCDDTIRLAHACVRSTHIVREVYQCYASNLMLMDVYLFIYLFICSILNDAFQQLRLIEWRGDKWKMNCKGFERKLSAKFKVASRHLPVGTEQNNETTQSR